MEELRIELNNLIDIKGIASDEVIKASTDLDKLIVKYYQDILNNTVQQLVIV